MHHHTWMALSLVQHVSDLLRPAATRSTSSKNMVTISENPVEIPGWDRFVSDPRFVILQKWRIIQSYGIWTTNYMGIETTLCEILYINYFIFVDRTSSTSICAYHMWKRRDTCYCENDIGMHVMRANNPNGPRETIWKGIVQYGQRYAFDNITYCVCLLNMTS